MKARNLGFAAGGFFLGLAASAFFLFRSSPEIAPVNHSSELVTNPHPAFRVYMAGEVHQQGAVEIRPDETVTVSQAIALAGGVDAFGDRRNVKLLRPQANGPSKIIQVDLKFADMGEARDPIVEPGDLINVPQRTPNF